MNYKVGAAARHEGDAIKGSRFIVDVAPATDEQQARDHLRRAITNFPDASHHCWAWRIATPAIDRANDDGEPSGSAGRPILSQIAGRNLVDTAVIVTRYFGGTKLGVGGLIRAYGGAAAQALDLMPLVPWVAMTEITFEHDYSLTDVIERAVVAAAGTFVDRSFDASVRAQVQLPVASFGAFAAMIADATAGAVLLTPDNETA